MKKLGVLAVILFAWGCSSSVKEQEPNNSFRSAQRIKPGVVIKASIAGTVDKDCYSLNIPDRRWFNTSIAVKLDHPSTIDLMIEIFKNRKLIKRIDSFSVRSGYSGRKLKPEGGQTVEQFANLALLPGHYIIRIRKAPHTRGLVPAEYTLSFKTAGRDDFKEIEPNDSRRQATEIDANSTIEGYLSPECNPFMRNWIEADWYKLNLNITNKSFLDVEVTGVPGVDLMLSVYDKKGRLIKKADSHREHTGEKISRLGIVTADVLYVRIASRMAMSGNQTTPYTLRTSITEYRQGIEMEPNDKRKDANPVKINRDITGYLTPGRDKDFYKITVPQPGKYMLYARTKGVPDVDVGLAIYNSRGRLLKRFNSARKGEPEFISNYGIVTTKYDQSVYVLVYSRSGENATENYILYVSLFEHTYGGEFEPNDSIGRANPISVGTEKKGFLFPQGDRDYFMFSLSENKNVRAVISGISAVDTLLRLYASNGKLLRTVNGSGRSEGERLNTDLKGPATYFLEVRAKYRSQLNAREPYTLIVKQADPLTLPKGKNLSELTNMGPKTNNKPKGED